MTFSVKIDSPGDIAGLNMADARKALAERQEQLGAILTEGWDQQEKTFDAAKVKTVSAETGGDLTVLVKHMHEEMEAIDAHLALLRSAEAAEKALTDSKRAGARPGVPFYGFGGGGDGGEQPVEQKSLGELFVTSERYAAAAPGDRAGAVQDAKMLFDDFEVKTLFETTAGFAPQNIRTGRVELTPERPLSVLDFVTVGDTDQAAVVYMEETTKTNAAAERAEGGAYAESALAYTERTQAVQNVGTFLPVTDQQLEDVAGIRSMIDSRLVHFVRERLDSQILNGNGTAPNIEGTLNVSGINTQAKGSDSVMDAVFKALTLVRTVGYAEANVIFMEGSDWQDVRLSKTADGYYLLGPPSDDMRPRLWGKPVVVTQALSAGTAVLGDYAMHAALSIRKGITVEVSDSHSDYFVKGKQAIRAGMRAAMVHYRPEAFASVTGL